MSAAMKVQVEAKPLHEPLAGGTPGATVVVEPMIAGHVDFPQAMMVSPGGHFLTLKLVRALFGAARAQRVPVPAFLIRHPSAGAILVDTGLHPSIATDGKENFGGLGNRFGKPTLEAGEDVPAQLRERGLDPGEIPVVVMTHMHIDHTSAISEFPKSTFVVSDAEWEAAATGSRPILNGYRRPHFDYAFDYRTVDFDRAGDRLLRQLRPHLRPLRRRLDPPRLHPRPQRRPHVGDLPPHPGRLRDRRRRDVHGGPARAATRRCRRAPSTPTTSAARCRSCGSSTLSSRTR